MKSSTASAKLPTFAPRVRLGRYELLLELARGGVATAIVARELGSRAEGRLVVIKRVHRNLLGNAEFSRMFRDEARLASSIKHPNVASIIDVIESGPELCLVMEYFEALSLATLRPTALPDRKPGARVVSRVVCDALLGLHAAHEAVDAKGEKLAIVHRDVSPQNIIADTEGVTRVIDFGIAKATSRLTSTKSGIVKGKVSYMAPEQIEAIALDRRADVFAAGVVLHEMLTGEPLFGGTDDFAIMRQILRAEVRPPSSIAAEIPPALDGVVMKALARSPDDRYPDALAFRQALERAMPPASPREVSVWVQSVGGRALSSRRKELLEMLREGAEHPLRDECAAPPPVLEFIDPRALTDETELPAGVPRRGTGMRAAAVVAIGVAVGVAALYASHAAANHDAPAAPRE